MPREGGEERTEERREEKNRKSKEMRQDAK